jgi:molecular chaperone GrpE
MTEQDAADAETADADAGVGDGSGTETTPGAEPDDGSDERENGTADPLGDVEVDEEFDPDDAFEDDGEVDDALVDRVAESDPESVARELAALRTRVDGLEEQLAARESEIGEVTSKLKRKQADFQNYKKRMEKRREQEKARATEDLVERLLDVRDNLVRALDQDDADVEALRSGVESTLKGFDRVLEEENVDVVDPEPGDEVDPHTHEVLMRVESDQPEDTVADVHRPGYVMAEKVLQTAQVTVSDGGA